MGVPDKCPKCGCTTLYSRERPVGTIHVIYDLESGQADFSGMYDGLSTRAKWLYYNDCRRRVCTIDEFAEKYPEYGRWS